MPNVIAAVTPDENIETLVCSVGNHTFTRKTTRGRKPSLCPEHKAERDAAQEAARTPRKRLTVKDEDGNLSSTWVGPSEYETTVLYPIIDRQKFELDKVKYLDSQLRKPIWKPGKDDDGNTLNPSDTITMEQRKDYMEHRSQILRKAQRSAPKPVQDVQAD